MNKTGSILNLYPDSLGGMLRQAVSVLSREDVAGAFQQIYILPSLFNSDLDRGFSIIDYQLNHRYAEPRDIAALRSLDLSLKLDFVLNHISVLSPQFQDLVRKGQASEFADFFINWNKFWEGHGTLSSDGIIQPEPAMLKGMFFRKPGLPFLTVRMPDGTEVPYWNTFYQEMCYSPVSAYDLVRKLGMQYGDALLAEDRINGALSAQKGLDGIDWAGLEDVRSDLTEYLEDNRRYLGQMDLNIASPLVWEYYENTLRTLADYGASIVRLDAFAYVAKAPGRRNFFNEPETWEILARLRTIAEKHQIRLLPEIHAEYREKLYEKLAEKGYIFYDFFLPGLILDALESGSGTYLHQWLSELGSSTYETVNMLGCHDGIPMLDLRGLLPEDRIQSLISLVCQRGGLVKDLHGAQNCYYQVNATFFSALGENEQKLLLARAIQLFTPGYPQIWYLDLFAGKNDLAAVQRGGSGSHKEINRTNLTSEDISDGLARPVVRHQLELMRLRNTCPAFDGEFIPVETGESILKLCWRGRGWEALLCANLCTAAFEVSVLDPGGKTSFAMKYPSQQ